LLDAAPLEETRAQAIDLFLGRAVDEERDRLGELLVGFPFSARNFWPASSMLALMRAPSLPRCAERILPWESSGRCSSVSSSGPGALVAFFIGRATGIYDRAGEGPGIIASIIGATVVLGLYRLVRRPRMA
jgi:uncharacterized membrane protein YeaQ/YmgE (transglycosylase-associated protein family)